MPSEILRARIILLQKTSSREPTAAEFRPISLLCTDYKIMAKAVSRRLNKVMNQLVGPEQTGFIARRSNRKNIAFARDLLEYNRDSTAGRVIAFLDFENAFDRVSLSFLHAILRKLGLPDSLISTVQAFYRDAQVKLEINGRVGAPFYATRGVRQGSPLSPILNALLPLLWEN